MLIEQVRAVRTDVPLGIVLQIGVGDNPRLTELAAMLGDSWMGHFIGEPSKVTDAPRNIESFGIEREQLTPYVPEGFELLPSLCD